MKKYITLFTFVCVLFLGIQTATAQQTPEIKAKLKTIKLDKIVDLSDTQMKQAYELFLAYEKANKVENDAALDKVRSQISELLQAEQKTKFKKSFEKEKVRKEKIQRAQQ